MVVIRINSEAFDLGHESFRAGLHARQNPYTKYPSWNHDEWYLGWYRAKQEHKRKVENAKKGY